MSGRKTAILFISAPMALLALAGFSVISLLYGGPSILLRVMSGLTLLCSAAGLTLCSYWAVQLFRIDRNDLHIVFAPDDFHADTEDLERRRLTLDEVRFAQDDIKKMIARLKAYRGRSFQRFMTRHLLLLAQDRLNMLATIERQRKKAEEEKAIAHAGDKSASAAVLGYRHGASSTPVEGEEGFLKEVRQKVAQARTLDEAMSIVNEFEQMLLVTSSIRNQGALLARIKEEMYNRYFDE